MTKAGYSSIILSVTILLFGCATGRNTASPTVDETGEAEMEHSGEGEMATSGKGDATPSREGSVSADAADLRQTLSAAVDDRSQWDSLHLLVECVEDAGMRSAEIYGNGVGIWDHRRQFTLTPAEISSLLRILDQADFPSFANIYGGKQPDPRPHKEGTGSAIQVICRVTLSLAGQTKRVVQRAKGEQSAELMQLAGDLLAICGKPGRLGTPAADLKDGLEKVSRGVLAPETFELTLYRRPETASPETGGGGFLLHLSGRRATRRGYDPAAGLLDTLSLTLSPAEVADLARELAGLNPARLPLNLFAQDYTDLSVEVLNHKKSVQARQFAGMTPTKHGERQIDFDQIYDTLYQLQARVLSDGLPAE